MLSSRIAFGAKFQCLFKFLRGAHLNLHALAFLATLQSSRQHRGQPAAQRDVIVLDKDAAGQIEAMIRSPAALHGVFFQSPQSRHGLARVEHTGVRSLNGIHESPRQRGDAAQVLHQIQNHPLATEQHARIVADDGQHLAIVNAYPVEDLRMADDLEAPLRRGALVEAGKDLKQARHRAQPANHHLLPRDDRACRLQRRIDGQVGRGVAGGLVFDQGPLQQCVDAAALPVHGSFLRGSGLRLRLLAHKKFIN